MLYQFLNQQSVFKRPQSSSIHCEGNSFHGLIAFINPFLTNYVSVACPESVSHTHYFVIDTHTHIQQIEQTLQDRQNYPKKTSFYTYLNLEIVNNIYTHIFHVVEDDFPFNSMI